MKFTEKVGRLKFKQRKIVRKTKWFLRSWSFENYFFNRQIKKIESDKKSS